MKTDYDILQIECSDPVETLYFRYIDCTHIALSYDPKFPNEAIYHIGQLSHQPYYYELYDWMKEVTFKWELSKEE